jgi:hypothetical protein
MIDPEITPLLLAFKKKITFNKQPTVTNLWKSNLSGFIATIDFNDHHSIYLYICLS